MTPAAEETCAALAQQQPAALQHPEVQGKISSKYRGLCWDKKHRAWRVRIFFCGKQRHVGRYRDDVTAARAYDKAAVYLYGSKAILNFSMAECLADPSEISGFITLAKEQAQQHQLEQQQAAMLAGNSASPGTTSLKAPGLKSPN
ncbi:hypothetical protein OEZ86_008737 [Tetradesmus obliquus]|nr:hypothetical protein OEZ86_008737 [Tetradesmus obliquus]